MGCHRFGTKLTIVTMIGHVVTEVVAFVPKLILFRLTNQLVLAFKHLLGYKVGTDDTQAIYTCRNLLEHLAFVLKKVAWGYWEELGTLGELGTLLGLRTRGPPGARGLRPLEGGTGTPGRVEDTRRDWGHQDLLEHPVYTSLSRRCHGDTGMGCRHSGGLGTWWFSGLWRGLGTLWRCGDTEVP